MPRFFHHVRAIPGELKRLPGAVKGISLVIFLYYLGWSVFEPFLPIYFKNILGSFGAATFVTALLYLFGIAWSFPAGEFVDRFSKRTWVRIMLLLYLPLWFWLAVVRTVMQLVVFRVYHSFLATNLWAATDSYLRSHSPDQHQSESVGLYDVGISTAMISGAVVGGALLLRFDIRMIMITIPVALTLIAFAVARWLPDASGTTSVRRAISSIEWRQLYRKEIKDYWAQPVLRRLFFFVVILGVLGIPQMILLPLLSDAIGSSTLATGIMYALFIAPLLLEAPFSVLADRWSRRVLLVVGSVLATGSFLGLALIQTPSALFPLVFVLGSAIAMIKPVVSGVATSAMPHEHVGEMNGVYTASSSLGGFAGLLVLGPLADAYGIHAPFLVSGVLMMLFLILVLLFWPRIESGIVDASKRASQSQI